MNEISKKYFFCGIGGSGMLPLALLLKARGNEVIGSDRSCDQGKNSEKFSSLKQKGITLCPQDGSGIADNTDFLVVSSAVEDSIPDVKKALELSIPIIKRGALLAEYFNVAKTGIAVAGTSGKSTVTGMIATMLTGLGLRPTFVNGGAIRMGEGAEAKSVQSGQGDLFVAEMDESDGSIAHYNPAVAVLNNIALDHKSMEELEMLFGNYLGRASKTVIVNADDFKALEMARQRAKVPVLSFGIGAQDADLSVRDIALSPQHTEFQLIYADEAYPVRLQVPGKHNISNALAALSAGIALGLDLSACIKALEGFHGIHRRLEYIGAKGGITVIDDFAHNPDKILASLQTLKAFDGQLIVMFQPHGFGPLKLMGREMMEEFTNYLEPDDYLLMPEAYYAGGTVDRSVTAKDLIDSAKGEIPHAHWFENRESIPAFIQGIARAGDRIVIMGARDDTLHDFAHDLLDLFE